MSKKSIIGHSHTPAIQKGVYQVGSSAGAWYHSQWYPALDNPPIPTAWQNAVLSTAQANGMFGEGEMCGRCAATKLCKSHDPYKDARWKCFLCGTDWMGIEPGNDRRGAIMAQRRKGNK